jgi:cytoskeletal protein CcmA (bactofilin family)
MAMFSGKGDGPGAEAVTLIGEEAYFHGVLAVKGSLRVEGVVEGDITDAVAIEIGKKGRIKGNVAVETLSVAGQIEGDIVASHSVELLTHSRCVGNVKTPRLRIEDGAFFEGNCTMTRGEEGDAAQPAESYQSVPNS